MQPFMDGGAGVDGDRTEDEREDVVPIAEVDVVVFDLRRALATCGNQGAARAGNRNALPVSCRMLPPAWLIQMIQIHCAPNVTAFRRACPYDDHGTWASKLGHPITE